MTRRPWRQRLLAARTPLPIVEYSLGAIFLCMLSGCNRESEMGVVSGQVTFKGKPITMGTIQFFRDNDIVGNGAIVNGAYRVERAPLGPVRIVIASVESFKPGNVPPNMEEHRRRMFEKGKEMGFATGELASKSTPETQKGVRIPSKYNSNQTSGLTYEVQPGEQTHDIDLQP